MTSETVTKMAKRKDKIESRTEYLNAVGYDVELTVTYRRVRRVRATNPDMAKSFAEAREARYAPKYFRSQNLGNYVVDDITATDAKLSMQD